VLGCNRRSNFNVLVSDGIYISKFAKCDRKFIALVIGCTYYSCASMVNTSKKSVFEPKKHQTG
jgi:hypothetical protein